ncbi:MAG TPA: ABC transporter permease [Bryobacteraceae bacterium]|nr:ABC transporter permease [Bryobacteraceae bacterium]
MQSLNMQSVIQDFRFALRLWRQRPGFTAVALLSLALGIGANTSIFSLMDALMLRSLPVKNPKELMLFGSGRQSGMMIGFPQGSEEMFSQSFLKTVRQKNAVFSDVGAMETIIADVHARFGNGDLEPMHIRLVSGNYFTLLGVGPSVGRVLSESDDQDGNPVAVMSYRFWQRRFSRDAVVGRAVSFNGTAFTILGVAAKDFSGTVVDESPDLWIPLSQQKHVQPWFRNATGNLMQSLWLTGRLKPGVTRAAAQANTNVVFQQWLHEVAGASPSPERIDNMKNARIELNPASIGISDLRRKFSNPLQILMVLVGVVLLIACVNIANLMLAQATGRQREIAVRLALGANRGRLTSQFLAESLMLALMGGALGVLIAWWGGQLLLTLVQADPANPLPIAVGPNPRVLLFTFGLSLATGVLFGLAPALRMAHVDLAPSLREGKGTARSRSRSRLGQFLVAGQVALALFLMIGAGLFVRTLQKLEQTGAGFDASSAVLLHLDSDASSFKGPAQMEMHKKLIDRLRALPGVQAASFSMLNFNEGRWMTRLWPEGVPHLESNGKPVDGNQVGTQYFAALGMPVAMGRSFGPQDTPQSQPAIVLNETLARALYPGVSPVGRHVAMEGDNKQDLEIVGVVKDAKYENLRDDPRGMFFIDLDQSKAPNSFSDLVVRATGRPDALMPQIRSAVHEVDPNLAVWDIMTLREAVDRSLGQEKLLAKLASFFGGLALLLSAIGLYGVMAYSVARRTNEIGIRMALGAQPGEVLGMVLRESGIVVGLGLLVGIPAALACGRYVASQLYGLAPNDPVTISAAAALLIAVALLASYLPARRAATLDPLLALREE